MTGEIIIQSIFLLAVASAAAVGAVMLLMALMELLPMAITKGWRWCTIAYLPFFPLGLIMGLKSFDLTPLPRSYAMALVGISLIGPLLFCWYQRPDSALTGKRLLYAFILIAVAAAALYGLGPYFAQRYLEVLSTQPLTH